MKAKHCGGCRLFKNEDINGNGWCGKYEMPTHCASGCIIIKPRKENKGNLREISSNPLS